VTRRFVQLVVACAVLGVGVALLLDAALGSDGYAALVNGLTLFTGMPFWIVNIAVSVVFIAAAWLRGRVPGVGTLVQPVVVGVTVSLVMPLLPTPAHPAFQAVELALAFVLLCVGVAGYLAADLGAGPAEAAALAWDPPIPFKWSYTLVQATGASIGWLLGAAIGPGTVLIVLFIGPTVDWLMRTVLARIGLAEPRLLEPTTG